MGSRINHSHQAAECFIKSGKLSAFHAEKKKTALRGQYSISIINLVADRIETGTGFGYEILLLSRVHTPHSCVRSCLPKNIGHGRVMKLKSQQVACRVKETLEEGKQSHKV